jgi:D-alanyl-D-alanine dipeptidase
VSSNSKTAWKSATATDTMTDGARLLQQYCTDAGLTPLASEWWHFNDLDAQNLVSYSSGNGEFWLEGCVSWRMFEE